MMAEKKTGFRPPQTGIESLAGEERITEDEKAQKDPAVVSRDRSRDKGSTKKNVHVLRVKNRSRQLMAAFRPVRLFLQALGRFPFETFLRVDGTINFKYKKCSGSSTMVFIVTSAISVLIFVWVTIGLLGAFFSMGALSPDPKNICDVSWEKYLLQKTMTTLIITWTWLFMQFIGSVYGVLYGSELQFYFNYWSRAVQVMDMDVTYGALWAGVRGNVEFIIVVLVFIILYFTRAIEILHDTSAMIINCMVRWAIQDIYRGGHSDSSRPRMKQGEWEKYHNKSSTDTHEVFDETTPFIVAKIVGFVILLYAAYGSRSFIIQFTFFCRVLRNAAWIWNERFLNHLRKVKPVALDQTKRRMDQRVLIKDHLILVQLFKMTEENFSIVLQSAYLFQVVHLVLVLYSFSLLLSITSCHEYWEQVRLVYEDYHCVEMSKLSAIDWNNSTVFENPKISYDTERFQNTCVNIALAFQVILFLFITTTDAAVTYEEAMRGWQILRRHSFMTAQTTKERNFMHSLIISFARNNPLQISAGGYFVVNRELLVVILLTVLIYFTVMIQFRPGQVDVPITCNCTSFKLYNVDDTLKDITSSCSENST